MTIFNVAATQSAIQTAHDNSLCVAGDTIQVDPGTFDCTSLSISKAITLSGTSTEPAARPAKGCGASTTNMAFVGASNSVVITKQAAGQIVIRGFNLSTRYDGAGNKPVLITGPWATCPVIFYNNNCNIYANTMVECYVPGGMIWSRNTMAANYNAGPFTVKDATNSYGSWTSDPTMGSADTTGLLNHYFEDNIMVGSTNGIMDADDGCRIVHRYNDLTYGMFNSHGYDTSRYGLRHFEIYENTYDRGDPDTLLGIESGDSQRYGNVVQVIWIRGGTGVVYNNSLEEIASGTWGACPTSCKPMIRISGRAYQEPGLITVSDVDLTAKTCGTLVYPERRQPGQSYVGGIQTTDPIYFWGNTNPAGGGSSSTWDDALIVEGWGGASCGGDITVWLASGRDYINPALSGGSAKAGYTAYTYPHPLITALESGGGGGGGGGGVTSNEILMGQVLL